MAQRIVNAENTFVESIVEQFGKTEAQARHILQVFVSAKAVKLDAVQGRYMLTSGAYWEAHVMDTALETKVK